MSRAKRTIFWGLLLIIVAATPILLLTGYYAVRKLTFLYEYCGSYGQLDSVLGWRLKPGAQSCLAGRNRVSGETYFESRIEINRDGFRDSTADAAAADHAVATIGDSWTFGYGLDYEESYPAYLSTALNRPVINGAVPAYGSAQALLLFERHLLPRRPRIVVYLTIGLWKRSICTGRARPTDRLKPCFWWNEDAGAIELVEPAPGYVDEMAASGVYPGGYLTAGFDSWSYFVISRPVLILRSLVDRLRGRISGETAAADPSFDRQAMLRFELARYLELARAHGFTFVLVDPEDSYRAVVGSLADGGSAQGLLYVDGARWRTAVSEPAQALAEADRRVPKDGHFGPGMNRLVAGLVAQVLRQNQLVP